MNTKNLKTLLGLVAVVLAGVGLTGCNSDPAGTPIDQRKPGQDLPAADRADKRGDVPDPTKASAGGK